MWTKDVINRMREGKWNGSYYKKNFVLILFIASIPGLITGLLIYWFAVAAVEDELRSLHVEQIDQRAKNLDEQFKYIEYSLTRWAMEPRFSESLRNMDFVKEFSETYDISKTLLRLQGTHPLIKEVELYINGKKPILFNSEYNVLSVKEKSEYMKILDGKNLKWDLTGENQTSLSLVQTLPAGSKNSFGSIIVKLNKEKALDLLNTLIPYGEGASFLLNQEKQIILSSTSKDDEKFESALFEEVEKNKNLKSSFQFKYDHTIYSVSVGKLTRVDSPWMYVSAAPMSTITAPLVIVSRTILIISAIALLLAFIMSWLASRKIYSPISKLITKLSGENAQHTFVKCKPLGKDEFVFIEEQWEELSKHSQSLQTRISEQIMEINKSFIFQLVQGYFSHYKEADLKKRMIHYGWKVEGQSFLAIDVQLSGLFTNEDQFSTKDESLVTFLASNIMDELAKEMFEDYHVITIADLSVGLLIAYPSEQTVKEEVVIFANKVTDTINQIIKMRVTVTISEPTNQIKKIHTLFEHMEKWKRLRLFENKNQIIDLEKLESSCDIETFIYPFALEKEIIQAIRMGQKQDIRSLIIQFIEELSKNGSTEISIQQGVRQLYSSIQHEILHSGIHPHELFNGKDMYEELSQIYSMEKIVDWFIYQVIQPFSDRLEGRMNMELKRIIENVIIIIQENYMKDISLDSCAEEVGTSPYSLSKAFKQIVGINFIDYLTQLRIEKAKELLTHSNMKINEIAESVGYRHSYFNRIFKKQIGIPPSQYRKINQENEYIPMERDGV